jgi:hypothetical protein
MKSSPPGPAQAMPRYPGPKCERLERGDVFEAFTAYLCDIEECAGTHHGQPNAAIQRNLRPDIVALLPDEIGACSIADGCGAGRFNSTLCER